MSDDSFVAFRGGGGGALRSCGGTVRRRFGLHTVVEHNGGTLVEFDAVDNQPTEDARVRMLAELTRRHAGVLLTERTADLRRLHLLQQQHLRTREEAAGLPRPAEAPPLHELLAACPPQRPVPCVYAAVVDDKHTAGEVAGVLGITGEEVEQMIRDHDTLRGACIRKLYGKISYLPTI